MALQRWCNIVIYCFSSLDMFNNGTFTCWCASRQFTCEMFLVNAGKPKTVLLLPHPKFIFLKILLTYSFFPKSVYKWTHKKKKKKVKARSMWRILHLIMFSYLKINRFAVVRDNSAIIAVTAVVLWTWTLPNASSFGVLLNLLYKEHFTRQSRSASWMTVMFSQTDQLINGDYHLLYCKVY